MSGYKIRRHPAIQNRRCIDLGFMGISLCVIDERFVATGVERFYKNQMPH